MLFTFQMYCIVFCLFLWQIKQTTALSQKLLVWWTMNNNYRFVWFVHNIYHCDNYHSTYKCKNIIHEFYCFKKRGTMLWRVCSTLDNFGKSWCWVWVRMVLFLYKLGVVGHEQTVQFSSDVSITGLTRGEIGREPCYVKNVACCKGFIFRFVHAPLMDNVQQN